MKSDLKKLKILFFVGEFPALSETFIINQINGLIGLGHHVDVYAVNQRESLEVVTAQNLIKIPDRVIYSKTPNTLEKRILSFPSLLRKYGVRHIGTFIKTLNAVKFGKTSASLRLMYDAAPLLHYGDYDVIHCHFGINGKLAVKLRRLGVLNGIIATTFHGYDLTILVRKFGPDIYKELFEYGDLFLPISKNWEDYLIRIGCDPSRIHVHKMGVDCNQFRFKKRVNKKNSEICVLSVARLVEKKGIEFGIRAVAKVIQQLPKLTYSIVGDGPLKGALEDLIERLEVQKNVKLLGWQSHNKIENLLDRSHIFLAPSVTASNGDQEGIPVVIMEAMAKGIPVVSTRHSGISELVKDKITGYLVEERNVEHLSIAIERLAKSPEKWHEMGLKGREIIENQHNIEDLNDKLVERFEKTCSAKINNK